MIRMKALKTFRNNLPGEGSVKAGEYIYPANIARAKTLERKELAAFVHGNSKTGKVSTSVRPVTLHKDKARPFGFRTGRKRLLSSLPPVQAQKKSRSKMPPESAVSES